MAKFASYQGYEAQSPTIQGTAYASGDLVGGKLSFTNLFHHSQGAGVIQSLTLADQASQGFEFDVVFFRADPTNTTFTDNSALDVHDTDLLEAFTVNVGSSDWKDFADNSVASVNPSRAFKLNGTSVLYACLVARGAYDADAATDLQLTVDVI